MDTTEGLHTVADGLEAVATRLIATKREQTGRKSEEQTHELGRAAAAWMVSLHRLADSGQAAWREADRIFARDDDEPEHEGEPDRFADIRAQLDLTATIFAADLTMDGLAHCELVLRTKLPSRKPGDYVPSWWPRFMRILDANPRDPMAGAARYLSLTLAPARDQLIVHRDPSGFLTPSFYSWGGIGRQHLHLDPERRTAAIAELRAVHDVISTYFPPDEYDELVLALVSMAATLGLEQRNKILKAYALAGMESPSMVDVASQGVALLTKHAERVEALSPK